MQTSEVRQEAVEQAYHVGGPLLRALLALFIPLTAIADVDGSVRAAGAYAYIH